MPARRLIVYPQGGPFGPVITTVSPLPPASVGTAYSFQMQAVNGTLPYVWSLTTPVGDPNTWSINPSTGVISGTPTTAVTENVTVTVTDALGLTNVQSLSFTVQGVPSGVGPLKLWRGFIESNEVRFAWWPPTTGPADSYNVYRSDINGSPSNITNPVPYATGITELQYPQPFPSTVQTYLWFDDWNNVVRGGVTYPLLPSTSYTYWVTAVTGGVESNPSPTITLTTLPATPGPIPPVAPTDPATFSGPPPATYGGTRWTVTISDTNTAGTPGTDVPPGTGKGNANCSFNWAGNNAAPGDTVVLNSNQIYNGSGGSSGAFLWNASGTQAQPIIVTVTQDPQVTPGGTLVPYTPYTPGNMFYVPLTLSSNLLANAVSGNLTTNWTQRSQYLDVIFSTGEVSNYERRMCHFSQGSNLITWNTPLRFATTATTGHYVFQNGKFLNFDDTSYATLQYHGNGNGGNGNGLTVSGSFVRFIGIYVNPAPSTPIANVCFGAITCTGNNVTFDRCGGGNDSTAPTWTQSVRWLTVKGSNTVINQCFVQGFSGGSTPSYPQSANDSQCVYFTGGNNALVENCFLECSSETLFSGGGYFSENSQPTDITIRGNFSSKNGGWSFQGLGDYVKNHIEFKFVQRVEAYDNIFQSNWYGFATGGQRGRCFAPGPIDQVAEAFQTHQLLASTWSPANGGTATFQNNSARADSLLHLPAAYVPVGSVIGIVVSGVVPAVYNGTYKATLTAFDPVANAATLTAPLPLASNPGPSTTFGIMNQIMQATMPWNMVSDVNAHDNQIYGVATAWYMHQDDGHQAGGFCERHRFFNNLCWINPLCHDLRGATSEGWAVNATIHVPDVVIDHNTFIIRPAFTGFLDTNTGTGKTNGFVGFSPSPQSNNQPLTVNRYTFTNNVLDGVQQIDVTTAGSHGGFVGTDLVAQAGWFDTTTLIWQNNTSCINTTLLNAYPSGANLPGLGGVYTKAMSAFPGNTVFPALPSLWNVNVAPYSTGDTSGGPIGFKAITGPPPSFALPNGSAGTAYSVSLPALNNTVGIFTSWTLVAVSSNKKTPNGSFGVVPTPSNTFTLTSDGTLSCASPVVEIDYFRVTASGSSGSVISTYVLNVGPAATNPVILAGPCALNPATIGQPYQAIVKGVGGSSPLIYSKSASSGSNSYNVSFGGVITGTPTVAGTDTVTVQATDGTHTVTQDYYITAVAAVSKVSRPSYNTGTGFFVKNGELYEPNGNLFRMRGANRTHPDSNNSFWQNPALNGGLNTCRFGLYWNTASIPEATQRDTILNVHAANHQFAVITRFANTSTPPTAGTTTSNGAQNEPLFRSVVQDWLTNLSLYSSLLPKMALGIANEYGAPPGATDTASTAWRDDYLAVITNITNISGTTITVNSAAATNPYATCPFAYIASAGGITNQLVGITARGGSAGAWTVTIDVSLAGYTSGGTLNGGAVGVLRAAGYNEPIVIDSGGFGQNYTNLETYSAAIFNSDPQLNIIFGYHLYGNTANASTFRTHLTNLVNLRNTNGMVFVVGEFGPFLQGGPSQTQLHINEVVGEAERAGFGWIPWSPDDHDGPASNGDDNWFNWMYTEAADNGSLTNKTVWGKQAMFDPVFGLNVNARPVTSF